MVQGLIFDFDGVICNSENFHFLAWKTAAGKLGVSFSVGEYTPFQGMGRATVIKYLCEKANVAYTDAVYARLSAVKSSEFARLTQFVGESDLIKGVKDFILLLNEKGYPCAVASSATSAGYMLKALNIDRYFKIIIDGTAPLPKKPDPAAFIAAANGLHLTPENCIVFEDSFAGVIAAKKGGFTTIGIGSTLSQNTTIPVYADFTMLDLNCLQL